ncbi:MAG: hypothetical protein IJP66_07585 [Kiritimatiellae bacterium]|nr:hypothetical protein [Kiritimatiellia bacterium]
MVRLHVTSAFRNRAASRGQAMLEYLLVALALLFVLSALAVLLRAEKNQAERAATLMSSEYP